jgi:hypothetical protein
VVALTITRSSWGFAEATWEYLSHGRWSRAADQMNEVSEARDVNEIKKAWASPSKVETSHILSEVQLHQIKTGLALIEELWRDFSMGSNHIAQSQFLSGEKYVKEIGKELFSSIFIQQTLPNQVQD